MDTWPAAFLILLVCVVAWAAIEISRPKTLEGAMAKMRLLAFATSLLSTALGLIFDLWRIDRDSQEMRRRLYLMMPRLPEPPPAFLSDDRVPKPFKVPREASRSPVPPSKFGEDAPPK
jgi:hypothetical protein